MTMIMGVPMPPPRSLVAFVGGPIAVAQVIAITAVPAITGWYQRLNKPKWTPPSWLFGPAWGAMYSLMGYSGWLVLHQQKVRGPAAALWATQLALNFAWQPLFFTAHKPREALVDIIALDIAVIATAIQFNKTSPKAAGLLLPYLAWCGFATALNYNIVKNNAPEGANAEKPRAKAA
jgi:benzodiazapine receptor